MEFLVVLALVAVGVAVASGIARKNRRKALEQRRAEDLEAVKKVADEDVTRFGEELQRLDADLLTETLDEATRQDFQRALDSYESAKDSMTRVSEPDQVRHVTEALEDGRYAVASVRARVAGEPLPTRRPPCFFNPAHGPSTTDVQWAPPGGQERQIPVCAADADRLQQGAEPDIRTVPQGVGRVPYWQAGPAYSPWASGYYGGYAMSGLLPGFLLGTLLSPGWDGGYVDGFDTDTGGDGGYDGGDGGGDSGGDGGGDYGGDGGGDFGGGWDFGGGGDFGGGDFGGF
ncbi:MAG: hypothetical protein HOQ22_00580 [Nocardioidaceae bacterium]|nr:hypothetical protein [Nocardioidaceae bacterium]NUS49523.1 hypothetical protein [Nocardioidaceae bacterium]